MRVISNVPSGSDGHAVRQRKAISPESREQPGDKPGRHNGRQDSELIPCRGIDRDMEAVSAVYEWLKRDQGDIKKNGS
jgi:hypothetical protein